MLEPGSKVALVCPCGPPHLAKARQGMDILRSWGLRPVAGPLFLRYLEGKADPSELSFLAASDDFRWAELEWALGGECSACWIVRGGYGLARLLSRLDDRLADRPVFGFSDATVLLHALHRRGWQDLVHCANLQTLPTLAVDALEATRQWVVAGQVRNLSGTSLSSGRAAGPLWGGNLCVLASLCGTPEALQPGRKILFLEDVNEAPYRVDRLLTQLYDSGAFEGLSGVALGKFTGCGDLRVLWEHWTRRWQVPVVCDLPFGHCEENYPLLLGAWARLGQNQISWVARSMRSGSGAGSRSSS
ncbi:LD-carboxypeptidase [bacterium]|nr:LD-carboxypeptidase [bacterium]